MTIESRLKAIDRSIKEAFKDTDFTIFDLETTGGNPERNGITEVFALRYSKGEVVDTFYSLVNPEQMIPPIVRKMTGINNRMLKDAPTIRYVMPDLLEFIGDTVLVSHNTIGDLKFLRYFAQKVCNRDLHNYFVCTHLLSEKLLAEAPDKSLKGLGEYLKLGDATAHRAEDDTYLTLGLFRVLVDKLKEHGIVTVVDAIRLQGDTGSSMRIGWGISLEEERKAQRAPGLIQFFDRNNRLLFATASHDMSKSIKALKQTQTLPKKLFKTLAQAYRVTYQEEPSIVEAILSEAKALAANKGALDNSHWIPRQVLALIIKSESRGKIRIQIGAIEEGTLAAFGPLHDRKLGSIFLDEVAAALGEKATRKGFVVDHHYQPLIEACILGQLRPGEIKTAKTPAKEGAKALLTKFFTIFGIKRLKSIKNEEMLSRLVRIRKPFHLNRLLFENGFLSRTTDDSTQLVYPVVHGSILAPEMIQGEITEWLFAFGRDRHSILQAKKSNNFSKRGLSRLDGFLYNATLWLIYSSSGQNRKQGLRYWDIAKIQDRTERYV